MWDFKVSHHSAVTVAYNADSPTWRQTNVNCLTLRGNHKRHCKDLALKNRHLDRVREQSVWIRLHWLIWLGAPAQASVLFLLASLLVLVPLWRVWFPQRASFILGLLLLTLARAADLTHPVSFEDFALNSYGSFEWRLSVSFRRDLLTLS